VAQFLHDRFVASAIVSNRAGKIRCRELLYIDDIWWSSTSVEDIMVVHAASGPSIGDFNLPNTNFRIIPLAESARSSLFSFSNWSKDSVSSFRVPIILTI
jgi:hypothetical protein